MKLIQAIIPMLFMSFLSYAQSKPIQADSIVKIQLDGPRKQGPAPLYILKYKGKTFSIDTTAMKNGALASKAIGSLDVVIDKNTLEKYGDAAKNGAIVITLNEEQSSRTFRSLKKYLRQISLLTKGE
jgi:hypothetical protein